MTVILAALTGYAGGRMLWLAMRKSWTRQAFMRSNFQGTSVPTAAGIVIGRTNLPLVNEGEALFHLARFRSPDSAADALEAFHAARRVLSEQLALEPGPDLRRLEEAILAHDPAIAPVPAARRRRGNLPAPSTSFVDRDQALAQVVELLREHRLVTLTGPPGVGKSRLALEVARTLEGEAGMNDPIAVPSSPPTCTRLTCANVTCYSVRLPGITNPSVTGFITSIISATLNTSIWIQ